jgi:hypothetical protein
MIFQITVAVPREEVAPNNRGKKSQNVLQQFLYFMPIPAYTLFLLSRIIFSI